MICKSCNFENKDGAMFCANCGKPLSDKNVAATGDVNSEEKPINVDSAFADSDDDSEANTTVLTSDMLSHQPSADSMQGGAPKPMGAPGPMGAPKPMGAPGSMGAPNGAPVPPKPPKANKDKPAKSGSTGVGAKIYIVISIVLIILMAGAGVWLYIHFNDKIKDISDEKDSLASQMDADAGNYESQISSLDKDKDDLETQISDLESQVDTLQAEVDGYQESSSAYEAYDALINFANSSAGQGYSDFFVSDTVLHLTGGEVAVMVYYGVQEESNIYYDISNTSVASCTWGDAWNGDVATLYVSPAGSGNTTITLYNDINDETITIYVYVD